MNSRILWRRVAAVLCLGLALSATGLAQDSSLTFSNILERIVELEKQIALLIQSAVSPGTNMNQNVDPNMAQKMRGSIGMAQQASCKANLRMIQSAKDVFAVEYARQVGDAVGPGDIDPFFPNGFKNVKCPAGGTYSINAVGRPPSCSVHGQAFQEGPIAPPAHLFP